MGSQQSRIPAQDAQLIAQQAELVSAQSRAETRVRISKDLGVASRRAATGPFIFYTLLVAAGLLMSGVGIANTVNYDNKTLNCTDSIVTLDLNCRPIRLDDCNYCPAQAELAELNSVIANPAFLLQGAAGNIDNSAVVQAGYEGTKGAIISPQDISTRTANAYGAEFIITSTAVTDYPEDVYDVSNPLQVCLGSYFGQTNGVQQQSISTPVQAGWAARYLSDPNYLLYAHTARPEPNLLTVNPGLSLQITRPTVFSSIAMVDMQFCARYSAVAAPGDGGTPGVFGPCTAGQPSQVYYSFCCTFVVGVGQHTYVCSKLPPYNASSTVFLDDLNVITGDYSEKPGNPTTFPSADTLSSVDLIGWVTRIQSNGPIDPAFKESIYLSVGSDAHGIVADFYSGAPVITVKAGAAVRTEPIVLS